MSTKDGYETKLIDLSPRPAASPADGTALPPARVAQSLAGGACAQELAQFFASAHPEEGKAPAVRERIAALPSHHRGALSLRFTPRKLPLSLLRAFGAWASVVVRLDCVAHPSAVPKPFEEVEAAAIRRLEDALARDVDRRRLARLQRRAKRLVADAIDAYATLRRGPPEERPPESRRAPAKKATPLRRLPEAERRLPAASVAETELAWFFETSEEELAAIPSNFTRLAPIVWDTDWPEVDELAEALHARRRIRDWLRSLPDAEAGVLQAAFEPHAWPQGIARVFGERLAGIAVRLTCDPARWPREKWAQEHILASKTSRLEARLFEEDDSVQRLRRAASLRLATALRGYVAARGGAPSAVRDL